MASLLSFVSFSAVAFLLVMIGMGTTAVEDPGVKLALSALILLGLVAGVAGLGRKEQDKRLKAWAETEEDHERRIARLERVTLSRSSDDPNPFPAPAEFRKPAEDPNG